MQDRYLNDLLAHDALPVGLGVRLLVELDCGAGKDTRLMLVAALEGVITAALPGFRRQTVLDPLKNARLLCQGEVIGKRLWTFDEKHRSMEAFAACANVAKLLDLWIRARIAYRTREKNEIITRLGLEAL